MIDLTKKTLPNTVMVGGKAFSVYTDFRLWMRFEIEAGKLKPGEFLDISYLFKNDCPYQCDIRELFAFSHPKNELPRQTGYARNTIVLDYEHDSDFIYAAFLQQYGIDLCDVEELHWHKFLALLRGMDRQYYSPSLATTRKPTIQNKGISLHHVLESPES